MVPVRANRLLPMLGVGVALMGVFVGYRALTGGDEAAGSGPVVMKHVPQSPPPDADTPAETIQTLTALVADLREQMKAQTEENEALRRDNRAIEKTVTQRVRTTLEAEQRERNAARDTESGNVLSSLTERVDELAGRVSSLKLPGTGRTNRGDGMDTYGADIPVGFGFDEGGGGFQSVVWIDPLERRADPQAAAPASGTSAGKLEPWQSASNVKAGAKNPPGASSDEPAIVPVYTIPENATLVDATAFTALVGRIPVNGQVRDPMPFKLLVGADNLAANGLTIPGLEGTVWRGTAVGDWTLSCVTGQLTSVTFVFRDGTIRTVSSDGAKPLGTISDDQGIPCVSGERITNAPQFLTQRILVTGMQAGADAYSASETTSTVSPDSGVTTSSVTGDADKYVLGRTVAGGAEEIRRWLDERQRQSFDAVFVRPGVPVAVHVDAQIDIDFDPGGRRLHHVQNADPDRRTTLD